jgi:hypothetical protein
MRCARSLLVVVLAISCGGCFHMTTVLKVNGDGAGMIEHSMVLTNAAVAQLKQFAMFGGGRGQPFDPISEQQARDLAAVIGEGVIYVSSKPVVTDNGQGRDATYSFADVNRLKIATQPPTPGNLPIKAPGLADGGAVTFSLAHQPGGSAVLHIHVPEPNWIGSIATLSANGQLALIQTLLKGAHILLAAEPTGTLVRTSSPYADSRRVTLLEVDLDDLLKDQTLVPRLTAAKTPEEVQEILRQATGLKINFDSDITVEFTPEK